MSAVFGGEDPLWVARNGDPVAAVARLASAGGFDDYVVYERPGEWTFAGGTRGAIELDSDSLRVRWDRQDRVSAWSGLPARALDDALSSLPVDGQSVYGWIGFEFCAYHLRSAARLQAPTKLARLLVPHIEVHVTESGARIDGGDDATRARIRELLLTPTVDPPPATGAVDVRTDPTSYRDRVAKAVEEIRCGTYQKVILSREVTVPFAVDLPATYVRGRTHNSPARSFLLRLGGLAATGFSPELVGAVDAAGLVTTEPLAGTRAFGRGADLDLLARTQLETDPKEITEHAVSVRASFADVASIAEPGSPCVSDFMSVRQRGSVQHLASTVQGRLARGRTNWEALEALFPSVTVSGVPKAVAVDAIFRLDEAARGLYSGAVVRVSHRRSLEAALVLRAVYAENGRTWLRAGAGVIAQSSPDREFEETCEKFASIAPYLVPARE
ncbi:MAG: salicylate synthase [Rhodococcus sp. (in: high G+C Gram-positive bacteria)]